MIRGLIFDFLGTIAEPTGKLTDFRYEKTYRIVAKAIPGMDYDTFFSQWHGQYQQLEKDARNTLLEYSFLQMTEGFLDQAGLPSELAPEVLSRFIYEWGSTLKFRDELRPVIQDLGSNMKLAVASNLGHLGFLESQLALYGVKDFFDELICSSEFGMRKPHPGMFQLIMKKFDLSAEEILVVGHDPASDEAAAEAAGMQSVMIGRDISDISDLPEYIAGFKAHSAAL